MFQRVLKSKTTGITSQLSICPITTRQETCKTPSLFKPTQTFCCAPTPPRFKCATWSKTSLRFEPFRQVESTEMKTFLPVHHCFFHQVEGLYIDKDVSFRRPETDASVLLRPKLFGKSKIRLRPSYFPFTEPSAEVDVYWGLETETDYRMTKGTWLA